MNSTSTLTKTFTKSSRSLSTGPIILTLDNDIGHHEHDGLVGDLVSPPSPGRPRVRPLRRKKHLSIYRASAPPHSPVAEVAIEIPLTPRPQSMVSPPSVIEECPPSFLPPKQMHGRSHSQPNVRLGHPSRPYYSAIRKNMSRPNSPDSSTNSPRPPSVVYPRTTSPTFGYLPRTFEDSDDDETPNPSRAASPSAFLFGLGGSSIGHSGSSVSGEMEMRMALANLAVGPKDSSFQFQETGKMRSSVHGRMKKLGKGLKDLVRGKQHA